MAALRRELRMHVDNRIAMLFGWTRVTKGSSMGDKDQVQTADGEGSQRPVRRIEPWGLRGVPTSRVRSLWLRLGASNVFFIGIAPSKGYGPQDLEEGETALYNLGRAVIRLFKNDAVAILTDDNVFLGSKDDLVPLQNGVVLASGIDPFTGATYGALGNASATVMAKR